MNPFTSTIFQIVNGNTLLLSNQTQVILAGVSVENQIAAKEFLRSKVLGTSVVVTPFKQISDNKVIGIATVNNFDLSLQLAKNGLGQPFGTGSQADLVKNAIVDKKVPSYQTIDMTKNTPETQAFIKQNSTISGYIDYVISPEKVIFAVFKDHILYKFLVKPANVVSLNENSLFDLQQYVQKSATLTPKHVENGVVCSELTYLGVNKTTLTLSSLLIKKQNYGLIQKKEKGNTISNCVIVGVNTADSITVQMADGLEERFYLSSIYAPRINKDIVEPFAIEAREFLRKELYSKTVDLIVDYDKNERKFVSIMMNNRNFNEKYLKSGYVQLMKHAKGDLNRAYNFDDLLEIEQDKPAEQPKQIKIVDFQDQKLDEIKTKVSKFASQKTKLQATVEQIISGGKYKCLLQLNQNTYYNIIIQLGQVYVPQTKKFEKYSQEALEFARDHLLYKKVNLVFTGQLEKHTNAVFSLIYIDSALFNAEIVHSGLGKPQKDAIIEIQKAEAFAKEKQLLLFEKQIEIQHVENGKLMCQILNISENCDILMKNSNSVAPKVNSTVKIQPQLYDFVAVQNENGFRRAKITNMSPLTVFYVDFGIFEQVGRDVIFKLEKQYFEQSQQVFELSMAQIQIPQDMRYKVIELIKSEIVGEILTVFVQDNAAFIMAPEVTKLNAHDSISGYLLEKGFAKLDDNCQESEIIVELGRIEGEAMQAGRGMWKK